MKARVREMAAELIRIAAARELRSLPAVDPPAHIYDEFCARFPYQETEDQEKAIADVHRRSGEGPADGPAHLRRCRLRQDRGRVARRLRDGDERAAGRGRGADHAAGAPAFSHLHRALRGLSAEAAPALAFRRCEGRERSESGDWKAAMSISSSARTRCSPRASCSAISALSSWTRSSISASATRSG